MNLPSLILLLAAAVFLPVTSSGLDNQPTPYFTWQDEAAAARAAQDHFDFVRGEQHALRAVELAERSRASAEDRANLLDLLAATYHDQQKNELSEKTLLRSLKIRTQELGRDDPSLASTLRGLSELAWNTHHYSEAMGLLEEGLALQTKGLGPTHPEVARSLCSVGLAYQSLGDLDRAERYERQSVEVAERLSPPDDEILSCGLLGLASVLRQQGREAEAKAAADRAAPIMNRYAKAEERQRAAEPEY